METQAATPAAYRLLHRGSLVLAEMEHNGIAIDTDYLDRTIAETGQRIRDLERQLKDDPLWAKWQKHCRAKGKTANLGSRTQLAEMLFDVEGLAYGEGKTATGKYRTDADVLRDLDHPFVGYYLDMEELKKTKSTFLEGTRKEVVDGFLHPFENLHTVATFRSSSDSPNLHNFPSRDKGLAELVRQAFIPRRGRRLVENDFGALEFRIAACFWKDPQMVEYASDPTKDIHWDKAAECFLFDGTKTKKEKQVRYVAKNNFVFPIIYGSYHKKIARNLWESIAEYGLELDGVPLKKHLRRQGIRELGACDPKQDARKGAFEYHIKEVEERFQAQFPVFAKSKEEWIAAYHRDGYFRTMTGFVVQWGREGLPSRNDLLNYPIQGPGFHCLLWTLIRLQKCLRKERMRTKLVGQIHDCVLADVPDGEVQDYLHLVKHIVTVELPQAWDWIIVPLEIEAEVTPVDGNWFQKTQWVEQEGVWAPKT